MALKKIQYDVRLLSTEKMLQANMPIVYTNDLNSAEFVFSILDMTPEQLAGATATTLLYMRDGSFFQNSDVNLNGNTFTYLLKENEGNHSGLAKIQLVVKIGTAEYASQLYSFGVVNGLETKVAVEVIIQDWTTLLREARAYIAQFLVDEEGRQATFAANEKDRQLAFEAAEALRQQKETERQGAEATRQQQFDDAQTARTNIFTQSETDRATVFEVAEALRQQKEIERQEAESGRIEDEQSRVDAEGTRQTTFTTNEASRTETFNANEATRQQAETQRATAESVRVANEAERISKDSERDSKIDSKADVSKLELYAKKAQEAWITPTLLNSWVDHSPSVYSTIGYYKDALGIVHLKGVVKNGTSNIIFKLPLGYRPSKYLFFETGTAISNGNIATAALYIAANGDVYSYATTRSAIFLDGITFRAEG